MPGTLEGRFLEGKKPGEVPVQGAQMLQDPGLGVALVGTGPDLRKTPHPGQRLGKPHIQVMGGALEAEHGSLLPFLEEVLAGVEKSQQTHPDEQQSHGQQQREEQLALKGLELQHERRVKIN